MLLVDQLSSRYNDTTNPTEKNITATVGLVVHAAGKCLNLFPLRLLASSILLLYTMIVWTNLIVEKSTHYIKEIFILFYIIKQTSKWPSETGNIA